MKAEDRAEHLQYLFRKFGGKCSICGDAVSIERQGKGRQENPKMAVRFRTGSSYGAPGRRRPRVLACRACAQARSDQITASQPIEDIWERSQRHPEVFYSVSRQDGRPK